MPFLPHQHPKDDKFPYPYVDLVCRTPLLYCTTPCIILHMILIGHIHRSRPAHCCCTIIIIIKITLYSSTAGTIITVLHARLYGRTLFPGIRSENAFRRKNSSLHISPGGLEPPGPPGCYHLRALRDYEKWNKFLLLMEPR